MRTTLVPTLLLSSLLSLAPIPAAYAENPCRAKVDARRDARKEVQTCLNAWARDGKPGTPDPTDDCAGKVSSFVQAAKDVKACRTERAEQRKKK